VFWILQTKQQRYVWLTLTGYLFYAGWNWKFCSLMLFLNAGELWDGSAFPTGRVERAAEKTRPSDPVTADLLLLGFFKYANFTLDGVSYLFTALGQPLR